ncbi:MAG: hypothetical protein KC464_18230, partial [Myxococcales bacterium]|nr:hypothetical protein [Myxococcales bacterium]
MVAPYPPEPEPAPRRRLVLDLEPWTTPGRAALIAGLIAIGLLGLWMALDGDGYLRPLDDANLAFHEAGHMFYGLFGAGPALYGGTLGQLTFPALAAASFWWRRDAVGAAVAVAWLGQNFLNIARYADDARAQALPLVGGGEHDWFHILGRWHALDADHAVAATFRAVAFGLVVAAAA